jgi:conjugal transfer/entry exclusion protein
MSFLTDAMIAALANLQTKLAAGGLTADQVTSQIHTVIDPLVADLNSKVAAIVTSEADDASKLADVTAAMTEFTTAFAPAAPAPAPAPETGA